MSGKDIADQGSMISSARQIESRKGLLNCGGSVQQFSPLLYWVSLLYTVGFPNFIHFDQTGRTHAQGLFNATSICQIIIAFLATYVLALVLLLGRRGLLVRRVHVGLWLWVPLLLQLGLATILQPPGRLTPPSATDLFLSLYRLWEWVLAVLLLLALYSRTPRERATELIVELIGRASWIWMAIVWIMLPVMPKQVYGAAEDAPRAVSQLGGQLLPPSYLASLAIAAFFYSLFYFRPGLQRLSGCLLAIVTIALAHTRIEQLSFLLLLATYAIFFSGRTALRMVALSLISIFTAAGLLFQDALLAYFSRGQSVQTLQTLDDRTRVWQAAIAAVRLRPWIGYGFIAGAKNAIRDHWVFAHWTPPHAHNELIQAALSGGAFAVLLVFCLYAYALRLAVRNVHKGPAAVMLLLLMILFTLRSIGGPNLTVPYTRAGALFLLTYIGIVGASKELAERVPAWRSKPS